ncbi:MurR/RpiR family transcriptional regulator [Salisediminibacterium beveridgei]|uniref:DNA binding transcriptional regulator, MurR/RpiR family n=1 Tax=Salisediminibacterium beveridgei TaxID=632773 RepID=A0A1D7QZB5_9BACI|nr:MurR/RpiR family transcriptional regulator [Salisediminibacterium beveridgei]AOM84346.1 DNA binding transcriptional regulator, MurR/RpiR family [Salisediminibacterium beveridgei]
MFTTEVIKSFNELEMGLYQYVIANKEKVVYMRIRDLANEAHVSTSTIMRFCRKLDCEGFSEFKVKLKMMLDEGERPAIKGGRHVLTEFFERTENEQFHEQLEEAAALVSEADRVFFVGIGSSGTLAEYGARYFSSLGTFSVFLRDWYMPVHEDLDNSVTIALSVSGENEFTMTHGQKLKEKKSRLLSITNNRQSSLARMADVNISYYITEQHFAGSNITTQIPVVYILEEIARLIHANKLE